MLREYEIVFWAALNTSQDIEAIVRKYKIRDSMTSRSKRTHERQSILREVISRLMLTAYTTKGKLSDTRTNAAMEAFFKSHFSNFVSKHTVWSLCSEPDSSKISPKVMNATMNLLMRTYREELAESVDVDAKDNNLFH